MNQTNQTRPREYSVAVAHTSAASAVLPTHVYLFNVLDVTRAEGDNGDARLPVSAFMSFTDLAVVKYRRGDNSFPAPVNVASTGIDTFDLLSILNPVRPLQSQSEPDRELFNFIILAIVM